MSETMTKNRSKKGMSAHWKVLDNAKVKRVANRVAASLASMNQGILEVEDIEQECLLLIAGTPSLAERAIAEEYGLLHYELRTLVNNKFVRPLLRSGEMDRRRYKTVTHEDAEDYFPAPTLSFDDGSGDYNEEMIRMLLPAVWDQSYAMRLPDREDAPESDMPRAASNKATCNNHWAFIADIKTGWEDTPLSLVERRALLLTFGVGWTQREIAAHEGITQATVSYRVNTGISKIIARLNGAHIEEEHVD